jgi:hypothetical protein
MVTLVLQGMNAVLAAAFAVIAILIGRRLTADAGVFRDTWVLTGVTFSLYAGIMVLHSIAAAYAFSVGTEHGFFDAYLVLSPMANHGRTFLCWPFYAVLGIVAIRKSMGVRLLRGGIAAVVVGALVGMAYGAVEGILTSFLHLPTTAVIDTVGFVVLGSILILSLIRDTLDRHLWTILTLHGLRSAVAALFLVGMVSGASWHPVPWHLAFVRLLFAGAIVGLAMHRLHEANRNVVGKTLGAADPPGRIFGSGAGFPSAP